MNTYLTFNEYQQLLEEADAPRGNYVSFDVDDPGLDIQPKTGTVVPKGKFHVTVMYSPDTEFDDMTIMREIELYSMPFEARVAYAKVLDSQESPDKAAVVLVLDSPRLNIIHRKLTEMGLKHTYPEFIPHVTLAYDVDRKEAERMVTVLNTEFANELETEYLSLLNLKSAPIIKNWQETMNDMSS